MLFGAIAVPDDVNRTLDGRYIIVDGRRWRASDPSIPDTLRSELVSELMSARRSVGAAKRSGDVDQERSARRRVSDAKVALGERGRAWWDPPEAAALERRAEATMRVLLRHRSEDSSICPSEVARITHFADWRNDLAAVHRMVTASMSRDEVVLTRGSDRVESFEGGPVRLRRGPAFPDPS